MLKRKVCKDGASVRKSNRLTARRLMGADDRRFAMRPADLGAVGSCRKRVGAPSQCDRISRYGVARPPEIEGKVGVIGRQVRRAAPTAHFSPSSPPGSSARPGGIDPGLLGEEAGVGDVDDRGGVARVA